MVHGKGIRKRNGKKIQQNKVRAKDERVLSQIPAVPTTASLSNVQ